MLRSAASVGFFPPSPAEIYEARDLAIRAMGCEIATAEALSEIVRIQPAAILVARQGAQLSAVVANLLLKAQAREKFAANLFSGRDPALEDLCGPDDSPSIYYIWGVAGETKTARGGAMELCRRLRYQALASLTAFTRSATPAGRRAAIARLGFCPVSSSDDLLVSLPIRSSAS